MYRDHAVGVVHKGLAQRGDQRCTNFQREVRFCIVRPLNDARAEPSGYVHDTAHVIVRTFDAKTLGDVSRNAMSGGKRLRCCPAVCPRKTPHAKLRSTKVSRHDHENICQPPMIDRGKDRLPGRAGRFAIVAVPEAIAGHTRPVRETMVRGVVVFLPHASKDLFGLVCRAGMRRASEKPRTGHTQFRLRRLRDCGVFVNHPT
jgi:hypothetical protein